MLTIDSSLNTLPDTLAMYWGDPDYCAICYECSQHDRSYHDAIWWGVDPMIEHDDETETIHCEQCGKRILSLGEIDDINASIERTKVMLEYCDQQYDDTSWF